MAFVSVEEEITTVKKKRGRSILSYFVVRAMQWHGMTKEFHFLQLEKAVNKIKQIKTQLKKERFIKYDYNYTGWTQPAIDCYECGCVCTFCPYSKLESGCRMYKTVQILLNKFGEPKK